MIRYRTKILKASLLSPFFPWCLLQQSILEGRKSKCTSLHGCAGQKKGDRQTDRLLSDCPETDLKQSDQGSSFSCPGQLSHVPLLHPQEGCSGDCGSDAWSLRGLLAGWEASKLSCVAGFALKAHLSSSPFARESARCYRMGFALLIYAFLTRFHKNGRRQHVLPLCPQLVPCSIFLNVAIKNLLFLFSWQIITPDFPYVVY